MLGCQDFRGYYDWTFHYLRREKGLAALQEFFSDAMGGESQQHFIDAATQHGLRGLHDVWVKTGVDEQCDWTFTLDESKNVLRWDMRQCPSKGFLLQNDLNADVDYCDHCMGWMVPMLGRVGMAVVAHEHNHCGQCWAEMRSVHAPSESLDLPIDIRKDPRWRNGYIDKFRANKKLPLLDASPSPDPCGILLDWFAKYARLIVFSRSLGESMPRDGATGVLMTDGAYVASKAMTNEPAGVLLSHRPTGLKELAARFFHAEPSQRPLLMHAYLPSVPFVDFQSSGLPRPVPILPQLIQSGAYRHMPHAPIIIEDVLLDLLVRSLRPTD